MLALVRAFALRIAVEISNGLMGLLARVFQCIGHCLVGFIEPASGVMRCFMEILFGLLPRALGLFARTLRLIASLLLIRLAAG